MQPPLDPVADLRVSVLEAEVDRLKNEIRLLRAADRARMEQMRRLQAEHTRVRNELAEYEGGMRTDEWLIRGMRSAERGERPFRFRG